MYFKKYLLFLLTILLAASASIYAQGIDPAYTPSVGEDIDLNSTVLLAAPDGKVLTFLNSDQGFAVKRLNVNGSIDNTFNCACSGMFVRTMVLQPDGKYLLAGHGQDTAADFIRVNPDGSLDPTFTSALNQDFAEVYAMAPGGKIYALSATSGSNFGGTLYRFNADGSIDNTFATQFFPGLGQFGGIQVLKVVVQPDGKVLIGGQGLNGRVIFRVNSDGTADNAFNTPVVESADSLNTSFVSGIILQPEGKIVISGNFFRINGLDRNNIARLNPDSGVDSALPANAFTNSGVGILPQSDGKIIVRSGTFFRLNADLSADNTYTPDDSGEPFIVDSNDKVVYLRNRALFRRNTDGSLDTGFQVRSFLPARASAVAIQTDGKALVGGTFKYLNDVLQPTFGRLNTSGSTDGAYVTGTGFTRFGNPEDVLKIIIEPSGKAIVQGSFTEYNGTTRPALARINTDGTLDALFAPTITNLSTIEVQADGKILLLGGSMGVNGFARTGIARLNNDGTLDTAFNPQIGSPFVRGAVVHADGKITIEGSFTTVNTVSRPNLARLNADGTLDATLNAGAIPALRKIALQPDGKYIVVPSTGTGVLRRNADGTADASFNSPAIPSTGINAILAETSGSVIIGGAFSVPQPNIARLLPDGTHDAAFLPGGANGPVYGLARQPDGKIIVVGDFSSIGGVMRMSIARINAAPAATLFDFDGDGRADYSVTRPGDFNWYQLTGVNYNFGAMQFGQTGDKVTPADFDGDGKTDVGVFRPATGDWWYRSSSDSLQHGVHWGQNGDVPLAGDYNGDGKDDLVAVRNYGWWIANASNAQTIMFISFGTVGDKLLVGDFDGDGKADPAVYRPSEGNWYYAASGSGYPTLAFHWGIAEDIPVPADYDGDGKTDAAVFRPSEGNWYVLNSSNGTWIGLHFGLTGDKPIAADYDGDGKADIAVYRPSDHYWYVLGTTAGFYGFPFGLDTDIPSPNAFVP